MTKSTSPIRKQPSGQTLKKLFACSGNICAYPGCDQKLVTEGEEIIGEVCHIEAAMPGGERYNPNQTNKERANFNNLILLCPIHHKETNDVKKYTVKALKRIKAKHEKEFLTHPYKISDSLIEKILKTLKVDQANIHTGSGSQFISQKSTINVRQGLNYEEVKQIFKDLFDANFPELQRVAKRVAEERMKEFSDNFFLKANKELSEAELKKFAEPSVQYATNRAIDTAVRRDDNNLKNTLVELLIKRVNAPEEELQSLVLSEAIETIGKLTTNQLKIITACYLLFYTRSSANVSWTRLNNYLKEDIVPFMDFKDTPAQFQHIEYAGCGSIINVGRRNVVDQMAVAYPLVFCGPFTEDDNELKDIPESVLREIAINEPLERKIYFYDGTQEQWLKKLKNACQNQELETKIWNIYLKRRTQGDAARKKFIEETDSGIMILDKSGNLGQLTLTSVGIVIAATYYEQVTGKKIDIEIWIN